MKIRKLVLLLFITLTGVFFWRQIFGGEVIYCCDNFLINIPSKVFLIEELRQGRFPLWNPYIFSGTPFFADINNALLYPLNALYAFLSPFRALTLGVILNFLIALTGVYVFARSIKLSAFGSFVAAIVFGFSGTMVVYTNNAPMLQVAALLPWVVWAVSQNIIIAVLVTSLQIISGHPQLTYLTWLFVAAWVLAFRRSIPRFGLVILLVFLLTAVQTLPFLEFVKLSTRAGGGYAYATFDSLHPLSIVRLILPTIVGNLSEGFVIAQGGSVYGYVGVLALLLAFFVKRRDPVVKFFIFAAILSFILALGKYTPVYWIAYHILPGLASFRSPQHFLLLYTFSMAILAGFGADRWKKPIIIAVVFIELFAFSRNNLLSVPIAQVNGWMDEAKKTAQKFNRPFVDQASFPYPFAMGKPFIDIPAETEWQAKILRPNLNMLYHIPSADGYASLVLKTYRDAMNPNGSDPTGVDLRGRVKPVPTVSLIREEKQIHQATMIGLLLSSVGALLTLMLLIKIGSSKGRLIKQAEQ
ncbi:hypothetical protein HY086_06675 [Candidatus Gottesmanbacteria bacterium]|nr:hypothetical protein [Candidatus Gottesmanbacteria bacterium]